MKKLISSMFILLCLFTISCKFEIPQKVSVKTKADYKLNVGSVKKDLGESLNISDLFTDGSITSAMPNARVFDYFPGGEGKGDKNVQQFLIKLPLVDMPVDMSQYFENSDISTAVKDLSFEQEITIPTINIEEKTEIDISNVNKMLNSAFSFGGIVGSGTAEFGAEFGSIEYSDLTLNIEISNGDIDDNVRLTVSNGTQTDYGYFENNKVQIHLGEFSFTKDNLQIEFSQNNYSLRYIGTINDNSIIKKATGVTYPTAEFKEPIEFPIQATISIPSSFVSATIKEGTLTSDISIWENTTVEYGINTTGAISINESASANTSKTINLNNKELKPGELKLVSKGTLTFNNATLDFNKQPTVNLKTDIKQFSEVVIQVANANTKLEQEDSFTADVYDLVKEIKLLPSGISGIYTNTLPEGNDITLKASSTFFGFTNKSAELKSGKESINKDFTPINGDSEKVVKIVNPDIHNPIENKYGKWDFNIELSFPGATTEHPDYIAIKDVEPGKAYTIGLKITPELNWEYAKITPPTNIDRHETQALNLNFSSLFDDLSNSLGVDDFTSKIQLSEMPIYIRAEKPGLGETLQNLQFNTNVSLFLGKKDENTKIIETIKDKNNEDVALNLIGKMGSPDQLTFVNDAINYEMNDKTLVTDISENQFNATNDLAGIINSSFSHSDADLFLDYSVKIGGSSGEELTINKADLDSTASGSISVTAFIVLPLKFKVANKNKDTNEDEPLVIDFSKLTGGDSTTDLLGREAGESGIDESLQDFSNAVLSCGIEYKSKSLPFYSEPSIEVKVNVNPKAGDKGEQDLTITGDTFKLYKKDIDFIFSDESYPYMPEFKINIPANAEFSLQRDLLIDLNLALLLSTDGTFNIF